MDLTQDIIELNKLTDKIIAAKDFEIKRLEDLIKKYEKLIELQDTRQAITEEQLKLWRRY